MVAQIEMRTKTGAQVGPCSCGCAPCDHTSCGLDCVIQPRYFCGQLLTDADLAAGVTWSQSKFRLSRRRAGWGVVCGLDVSCGPQSGMLTVHPGYAVDCCGNDIVVCSDAPLDLNKLFQQPPNPCEPELKKPAVEVGKKIQNGEEVVVDLAIHYKEEQILPATTLGRAACGQSGECEYSRIKESYKLTGNIIRRSNDAAARYPDPLKIASDNWVGDLKADLDSFRNGFLQFVFEPTPSADTIQQLLSRWLETHPLHQLCWLNGFFTTTNPQSWLDEMQPSDQKYRPLSELLFLVVQDRINHYISRTCSTCEDDGVPLARIWLKANVTLGKTQYELQQILPLPPYRREQHPDRLPAPLGRFNQGEVIWRSPQDARGILAQYDIRIRNYIRVQIVDDLISVIERSRTFWDQPFLDVGEEYTAVVYSDRYSGDRLVGFEGNAV
jgi:hypothetical protein